MDTIKKGMGLLLVVMAFYFVRPGSVLPAHIFNPLVGVAAILTAVFMGAFDSMTPGTGWWTRTLKGLGLVVFLVGLYYLGGAFIEKGFLMSSPDGDKSVGSVLTNPPLSVAASQDVTTAQEPATDVTPLPEKIQWTIIKTGEGVQEFLESQRAEAKAAGRPVMIDFWAQWCVYCKKLDKMVWNVPEVVAEAQRFTTIKVDATSPDDDEMTAIKDEFKVPGLPRVIFIDSRGEIMHGRSTGFKVADEMLDVMKSIR